VIIVVAAVIRPFIGSALRGIRISMQRKGTVPITIASAVLLKQNKVHILKERQKG
jgi:hypothetical protein